MRTTKSLDVLNVVSMAMLKRTVKTEYVALTVMAVIGMIHAEKKKMRCINCILSKERHNFKLNTNHKVV